MAVLSIGTHEKLRIAGPDGFGVVGRAAPRWLSYGEIAALHGITRDSAVRLVRRRQWMRRDGVGGETMAAVPAELVDRLEAGKADAVAGPVLAAALLEEIAHKLSRLEQRDTSLRDRLDREFGRAEQAETALRAVEGRCARLADEAEALHAALVEQGQVNAWLTGENERLRADLHDKAVDLDGAEAALAAQVLMHEAWVSEARQAAESYEAAAAAEWAEADAALAGANLRAQQAVDERAEAARQAGAVRAALEAALAEAAQQVAAVQAQGQAAVSRAAAEGRALAVSLRAALESSQSGAAAGLAEAQARADAAEAGRLRADAALQGERGLAEARSGDARRAVDAAHGAATAEIARVQALLAEERSQTDARLDEARKAAITALGEYRLETERAQDAAAASEARGDRAVAQLQTERTRAEQAEARADQAEAAARVVPPPRRFLGRWFTLS